MPPNELVIVNRGIPGATAYERAVALEGFSGTEQEWLESLKADPTELNAAVQAVAEDRTVINQDRQAVEAARDETLPAAELAVSGAGTATEQAAAAVEARALADQRASDAELARAGSATERSAAEAARQQAEAFATASASSARFYDTIALGRAAVADGETFGVRAGGSDGLTRPTTYRRDSSATHTLIVEMITQGDFVSEAQARDAAIADAVDDEAQARVAGDTAEAAQRRTDVFGLAALVKQDVSDFHTYDTPLAVTVDREGRLVSKVSRRGRVEAPGSLVSFDDEGRLSLLNRTDFFTYQTRGKHGLLLGADMRPLIPGPGPSYNSAGDLSLLNRRDFFTYATRGMQGLLLGSDFRLLIPGGAGPSPEPSPGLPAEVGREDVAEGEGYLDGEVVKKRLPRHPMQYVSGTTEYWSGDYLKLYALYDSLVARFPGYVSRSQIGADALGNPIHAYRFAPAQKFLFQYEPQDVPYPKIVLIGGQHGNERGSQITNITLASMLCETPLDSEVMTFLRHNVEIHIVPIACPTGVSAGNRYNHNLVDLNRNYDGNWTAGTGSAGGVTFTYGTAPFSEAESQVIRDFVLAHSDAAMVLDTHDGGSPDYYAWIATLHPVMKEVLLKASYDIVAMIHQELRPASPPLYPLRFAGHENGTMTRWAMMQGIKSALLEDNPNNNNFRNDVNIKREMLIRIKAMLVRAAADAEVTRKIISAGA